MNTNTGARHHGTELNLTALAAQVLETVRGAVVVWDSDGYPVLFNRACVEVFDYPAERFAEINRSDLIHPDERAEVDRFLAARGGGDRQRRQFRRRVLSGSGQVLHVDCSAIGFRLPDDSVGVLVEYHDITDQVATEERLDEQERVYQSLYDHSDAAIFTTGPDNRFRSANSAALELLGMTLADLERITPLDLVHPDYRASILERREQRDRGDDIENDLEVPGRVADGTFRWLSFHLRPSLRADGSFGGTHGVARDVTQERQKHNAESDAGGLDQLTGLPGRGQLEEFLHVQLSAVRQDGTPLSLVVVALDRFGQLNDRYGVPAGDAVLTAVAQELQRIGRTTDLTARYEGDTFAIVLSATEARTARSAAERALASIRRLQVDWDGRGLRLTASAGVVTWDPELHASAHNMVEAALRAVVIARAAGRDRVSVAQSDGASIPNLPASPAA
ncbi:MAG: sensor domain-containing diguanylate cyclase [Dehalococcoidia bacterium]|nr:sensor domain-containing diguanylate cyclase [Dehalococcoidia bacterium]